MPGFVGKRGHFTRWFGICTVNDGIAFDRARIALYGQKQFGPYTWVWRSRTFQPAQTGVTVEARCPAGDVVLGGGVIASPLWRDIANGRPGGTFTVTVYA